MNFANGDVSTIYSILQNSSTALKYPLCFISSVHPPLNPDFFIVSTVFPVPESHIMLIRITTTDIFIISIVVPFPEYHIITIGIS